MKKKQIFVIAGTGLVFWLFAVLLFSSCKKDKKQPEQDPVAPQPAIPASPTTTLQIDSSNANIVITKTITATVEAHGYSYHLDLDNDGAMDLLIDREKYFIFGGLHLNDGFVHLETLTSSTYVMCDSIYQRTTHDCPANLTYQSNINEAFPKALVYGDKIDSKGNNWRKGILTLYHYGQDPDTLSCHKSWVDGSWCTYPTPRYIAIVCQGKPGWLKLILDSLGEVTCFEFAWLKF